MTKIENFIASKDNPPIESFFPKIPFFGVIRFLFNSFGHILPDYTAKFTMKLLFKPLYKVVHKKQDDLLNEAKRFTLKCGDIDVAAYEWGEGDRTVLLVHGWVSRGTALRSFVPLLQEYGYKVVAFDGPAHGDSGGDSCEIPLFARFQKLFHEKYNIVGIITHSYGGVVSHYLFDEHITNIKLPPIVMISLPRKMTEIFEHTKQAINLPDKAYQKLLVIANSKGENRSFEDFDLESLMKIDNNVLIIHDVNDMIVPYERTVNIKKEFPTVETKFTKGFGHFNLIKNIDVIHESVIFIDKHVEK